MGTESDGRVKIISASGRYPEYLEACAAEMRALREKWLNQLEEFITTPGLVINRKYFTEYWNMLLELHIFTVEEFCRVYRMQRGSVIAWSDKSEPLERNDLIPSPPLARIQVLKNAIEFARWRLDNELD